MAMPERTPGKWLVMLGHVVPVLAVVIAMGPVTAAFAPVPARAATSAEHAPRNDALDRVSCTRAFWCMATGTFIGSAGRHRAFAEQWKGGMWRRLPSPPGRAPAALSCATRTFCLANGGPTQAEIWNGRSWHTIKGPGVPMRGLSCGSSTTCMFIASAKDGTRVVESWNGRRWHLWDQATNLCAGHPPGACGLSQVSCGNGKNCIAVGTATLDQEPLVVSSALFWNGTTWGGPPPPRNGNPAQMNAVGCAASFCLAAGGAFSELANGSLALAATWNASTMTWTDISPDLGTLCAGFNDCAWTSLMTCGSATNCLAFYKTFLAWNGSTWTSAPPVKAGSGMALSQVSCGGASCMAVGHVVVSGGRRSIAELWNGTTWRVLSPPRPT